MSSRWKYTRNFDICMIYLVHALWTASFRLIEIWVYVLSWYISPFLPSFNINVSDIEKFYFIIRSNDYDVSTCCIKGITELYMFRGHLLKLFYVIDYNNYITCIWNCISSVNLIEGGNWKTTIFYTDLFIYFFFSVLYWYVIACN